jgi:hypothetical protein
MKSFGRKLYNFALHVVNARNKTMNKHNTNGLASKNVGYTCTRCHIMLTYFLLNTAGQNWWLLLLAAF